MPAALSADVQNRRCGDEVCDLIRLGENVTINSEPLRRGWREDSGGVAGWYINTLYTKGLCTKKGAYWECRM